MGVVDRANRGRAPASLSRVVEGVGVVCRQVGAAPRERAPDDAEFEAFALVDGHDLHRILVAFEPELVFFAATGGVRASAWRASARARRAEALRDRRLVQQVGEVEEIGQAPLAVGHGRADAGARVVRQAARGMRGRNLPPASACDPRKASSNCSQRVVRQRGQFVRSVSRAPSWPAPRGPRPRTSGSASACKSASISPASRRSKHARVAQHDGGQPRRHQRAPA